MPMPRALASFERAMMQPSLFDSTTTGRRQDRDGRPAGRRRRSCCSRKGRTSKVLFEGFDDVTHHAPDREFVVGIDANGRICGIGRQEPGPRSFQLDPFDGELPIHVTDGDASVVRLDARSTISRSPSPIPSPVMLSPSTRTKKCRGRIRHQLTVQVERHVQKSRPPATGTPP